MNDSNILKTIVSFLIEVAYEKFFRTKSYYLDREFYFLKILDSENEILDENKRHQIKLSVELMPVLISEQSKSKSSGKIEINQSSIISSINDTKSEIEKLEEKLKQTEDNATLLQKSIIDLQDFLSAQQDYINNIKSNYNFVGISSGFEKIEQQKRWSRLIALAMLIAMASLIVSIPIAGIHFGTEKILTETWEEYISKASKISLLLLPLEIILIYFFRVILSNFSSISAQIVQLELRQSLCAFIQSYVEYKVKLAEDVSLEKFEEIIFSGIVMDPGQIPQTFDGLEKLASTINALKKAS